MSAVVFPTGVVQGKVSLPGAQPSETGTSRRVMRMSRRGPWAATRDQARWDARVNKVVGGAVEWSLTRWSLTELIVLSAPSNVSPSVKESDTVSSREHSTKSLNRRRGVVWFVNELLLTDGSVIGKHC